MKAEVKIMIAIAAGVGIASGARARTLCVAEQTAESVALEFGAQDGFDYELFLAHGAADGGEDKYAWDAFEKIADVPYDKATLEYEVPVALRDGRRMRFFLMQTANLNMAKELSYARSTGQQWVDTGVAPVANRQMVDFRFGDVAYAEQTAFFGRQWSGTRYLLNQQSNQFRFHGTGSANLGVAKPAAGVEYRFMLDDDNCCHMWTDGVEKTAYDNKGKTLSGSGNIAVFGCNDGTHLAAFTFYRMKLFQNNVFQADLVPAMNAAGEVGLYNHVNGAFCRNKTATPLEAGAVLPPERFGRVLDSTPSFGFRRAVSVASASADAVKLSFHNPDGAGYRLFVAYGPADCGIDKNAWASFDEVATIAGDASSYEYALPAALRADGVYFRFFLVKTDDLPYAAELVSLTSTGAQGVRTGYIPDASTAIDFKFGKLDATEDKAIFGQNWYWGGQWLLCRQGGTFKFGGISTTPFTLDPALDSSADYRLVMNGSGTAYLSHGGEVNSYGVTSAAHCPCDLTIFCNYSLNYGASTHYAKYDFHSMVIRDGGLVVRDFVPVETAAGKGALFDRASGRTFENLSATDFAKGAAVTRPGWTLSVTDPCLAGAASGAPSALRRSVKLAEDTEWSAIADGLSDMATIDFNGHELHVSDYAAFCAKRASLAGPGALRVTVPEGETLAFTAGSAPKFAGTLVKDGAGTLVISGAMTAVTGITVAEGVIKYGAQSVIAGGITVKVLDGAAIDMAGNGNGNVPIYDIAGSGPDGSGALRNFGSDVTEGSAQMRGLRLSADAKVGGTGNLGEINNSYNQPDCFDLNGHTLTIDIPSNKGFWIATANSSSPGTIYVKSGILYPYKKDKVLSLPNVDIVVDGAEATFRSASDGSKTGTFKSVTVKNGGKFDNVSNRMHMKDLVLLDGAQVPNSGIAWIYVGSRVVVSNETTDVTIYPPICNDGTYSRLLKYGAGALYVKNNHTDQLMNSGAEIFGGTVVMDSTASTLKPEIAISSAAVPVTIHAGGTLDMRKCTTAAFKVTRLEVEGGGALLHDAASRLSIAGAAVYAQPLPFGEFAGSLEIAAAVVFDLSAFYAGDSAPAAGAAVTLFSAGTLTRTGAGNVTVTGCPHENYVAYENGKVVLHTLSAEAAALAPIKIWNVGGTYVYGANGNCYRSSLGALLANEGWNVEMTGWRTANASPLCNSNERWRRHAGVADLALKTSAARAGLLEGLETYAAAANEPDFTVLFCGDRDVADGVADATVLANYKEAVTRIRAALPMTTVIACTIPGGSATLNADIAEWCAAEANVECVDVSSAITSSQTQAECEAAAAAIKAKLVTLANANGKFTPSAWTRPAVVLDATNNVPAAYLEGFTRVRAIEPTDVTSFAQNLYTIPYVYAPAMQETGIAKAGYYIELVRRDTGALQAMWIDMDAPGSTWADVALPVTTAQKKQQTVTKLHVWSNFGGVRQIPAADDSVEGYIEFNCQNYGGTARTGDVIAEPWSGDVLGFNDTFSTDGNYACFQIMRKFSEEGAFPAAEILFAYNRWGNADSGALGMGTLANYGNHGQATKTLDWTFVDKAGSADMANISGAAYSYARIEFWVKYSETPSRADMADFVWTGATDAAFATVGNWAKGETAATSLANASILLPENANQTFAYVGWDPVNLSTAMFMADGTATFPEVGGFYLAGLDMGATGKLVYDPVKFSIRLVSPPSFAPGAKIALASSYATKTKGRFLLMTWNNGSLDMDAAALNAIFDTASANGADVKVWAENLASGGRLWLDLDHSAPKEKVNVLCVGDSITQGSDSTYGNWRVFLMKRLAAAGYAPVAKGHWKIQSSDICGAAMPDEWISHSGISGQRLVTKGGGGTIDQIENILDQAGDVDFVLVKLCTNDINSNGSTAEELFPVWTNLVWKTLNQKPHAKFVAGAVVDIADAVKNARVVAFNAAMKNAIDGGTFPAKRAYFADLYTPCYRYDQNGAYIAGSFLSATDLHPDWPGEDKMAEAYCAAIKAAIADDADFELGASDTDVPTASGAEANVPAEFLAGYTRARVFDVAANSGTDLSALGRVPYAAVDESAPDASLARVGYYVELKRKNNAQSDYHGLTRYLWVSMDAFGGRTIADVEIPLAVVRQCEVGNLRVKTNMPGIESTAADAVGVRGFVEFWPSSYNNGSGNSLGPANTYGFDWNDTRSDNMGGYGSMQVHRITPGETNPAQVLFAFNRWTHATNYEIGLGNFSHMALGSVDWTFSGDGAKGMVETMAAPAYEVARIEIWTAGAGGAILAVGSVSPAADGVTVTGSLEDLGPGATNAAITLEWSTDPEFATIAGSQAVGTFAETGAIAATVTGLDSGTAWYFRFKGETDNGNTTTSPASAPTGYWRPQTASDMWTSVAWLKDNAGSPVTLNPVWTAMFDGRESVKTAAVQVPEEVVADQVVVNSAGDYTFTGPGKISSKRLVKAGSGTLTLDAAVLAETPDIDVAGGTVKLADTATLGAAGKNGGTITVKNGGRFDLNYTDGTSGNNRARANITSGKKFVIEGAGPDGDGALVSSFANAEWGSPINEIELAGDATIGGVARIDIRANTKNRIVGPTNVTLTVKTRPSGNYGLGFVDGSISVGKLNVAPEGKFKIEGATTINIPYGIDLYGMFMFYTGTGAWNVGGIAAKGTVASIGNDSGTAYVRTPLTVEAGAKLTMNGSKTTRYEDAVVNEGTVVVASGSHYIEGSLESEGHPFDVRGGSLWLSGKADYGDGSFDVSLSGASALVLGVNDSGYGLPKFGKGKLSVSVASGHTDTIYLHPATSSSIDGLAISGLANKFFSQGPRSTGLGAGPVVEIMANDLSFSANNFEIGNTNGRGELTVTGENSHIAVKGLYANWIGSHYYAGSLTFRDGVLEIGSDGIREAWMDPMRTVFNMESGTLRATADFAVNKAGMTATFGSPVKGGQVRFDLNGKSVKWGTGLSGASDVTMTGAGAFAPDRAGIQGIPLGKWTVESTGTVDLRNAAGFAGGLSLAENARATLDIAGTNMVEFLAWTWHDNAWDIMKPKFTGGAAMAEHVATSLTYFNRPASRIFDVKYGSGSGFNYFGEFHVSAERAGKWYFAQRNQTHFGIHIDGTELSRLGPNKGGIYNIDLAEGWHKFMISIYPDSANQTIGPMTDSGAVAAQNGVWFKVGGNDVGSWPADYEPFDSTIVPMRMRSETGARTSVRWRKYAHPQSNLAIYDTVDESLYAAIDVVTNSLQIMHAKFSNGAGAPLGGACSRFDGYFKVEPQQAGAWTFQGCFDDQIALEVDGRRLFTVAADCATAAGSMTLAAGWHKFDIRLGDNSSNTSGGTGGRLTDADGNVAALQFSVNGGAYHAFDERYLPIAYTAGMAQKFEKPGLGGVTELAAGSTLVNAPREGGWCPVYGTLKGAGTLSGPFRFTGEDNCWEVGGNPGRATPENTVSFENADSAALAGLRRLRAVFTRAPKRRVYTLGPALGVTAETVRGIALEVLDAAGADYADDFALEVKEGNLVLRNGRPGGMSLLFR